MPAQARMGLVGSSGFKLPDFNQDPAGSSSQISTQLAHGGGKVDSPMHRPPLSPRKYCW